MENQSPDPMSFISKLTIILPLVILAAALIFKFNKQEKTQIIPTIFPTLSSIQMPKTSISTSINLQGPWICSYQDQESSISAYIKDQQIFAEQKTKKIYQRYLIKDDCYYIWDQMKLAGEKKCGGIKQILGVVNTMLGLNILNINDITSYLPQLGLGDQINSTNTTQIQTVLNSCKKEKIDERIFVVPGAVRFTTTSK